MQHRQCLASLIRGHAPAALDNLNSYYELGDTTEPGQWGASTRLARNGAAGGEVEMGTLPAGEESVAGGGYGDDRVRLRGRRDQSGEPGALERSAFNLAFAVPHSVLRVHLNSSCLLSNSGLLPFVQ